MSFASQILNEFGILGVASSAIHSVRETQSLSKLLIAPGIDKIYKGRYEFDINSRFIMRGPGKGRLELEDGGILRIPNDPFQVGRQSRVIIGGTLELGNSYIGDHSRITCKNEITIGNGCALAWNVTLLDDDRHTMVINGVEQDPTGKIEIRDNVWIGHSATITKDVTIGESAVVASNSVVTSDVPPNTLVGGNPAEPIKSDVTWKN